MPLETVIPLLILTFLAGYFTAALLFKRMLKKEMQRLNEAIQAEERARLQ